MAIGLSQRQARASVCYHRGLQGSLWALAQKSTGASFMYKLESGSFNLKHNSTQAKIALCDLGFDVFGYLFAVGYDTTVITKSCTVGTTIYRSSRQVG